MDTASGEIRDDSCDANHVEEGWSLHVIGPVHQGRIPVNGAIARAMVRGITHITIDSSILYLGGRVFEVSIVYEAVFKLSMEVWVMCGNLREVRIRRATEGLGKNEVEHNVGDGGNAFCLVNGGRA